MNHYVKEIARYRPTSIWGYAGGIHLLAGHILEKFPDQDFPYLTAIITSSENLFPKQREVINRAFGGQKVFDNYGSREMYIAAECNQHNGYHIHGEVIYLEIVDKHNKRCAPGELGRVVLTDLSNHAFPFIRYEIGDIGRMASEETCACGVKLPKLQSIDGRIADIVVAGDRILTAPNFTLIFSDLEGVDAYQIRQDRLDGIDVFIVPGEKFSDAVMSYIENSLKELTAGKLKVSINPVREITVGESGKRRFIISTIGKDNI
jgi:phenylacetate-CoA ligase